MAKRKISVTIDGHRLDRVVALTDARNVSSVIDQALQALLDRTMEEQWLDAHPPADLPGEVVPDLFDVPWDDSRAQG